MNQVEVKRRQIQSFSYVLACINIWVFGKSIGDNGLGYLAAAVLVFALFWVLTGKNLPDRMGRMLRGRNARGQYRNVSRMRKNMMLFQIAEGLLGTVLCMSLGWILLEKVFLVPYGSMILWILSPALFLRCIQSVFLGYFQSEGSEMPSAVSSVLRQVFFLGLGLVFLGIFRNYGEKVSLLLKRTDFTSMYGAMGIAVGMLLSEVLVLLFVFVIYRGSMAGRREAESGMKGTDSFSSQLRTLLIPMGGDILRDMFLLLPLWIGLLFFQKRSADIYASVSAYGIFVGRYLITILMPVAILTAGILPGVARTGSHIRKKEENLMWRFYNGVKDVPGVKIYGDYSQKERCAIVTLNIGDYDSSEVSDELLMEYDISTRSGGHCAPLMHEALGTVEQGAVRFSFSHYNTEEEVDTAIRAIRELAEEP